MAPDLPRLIADVDGLLSELDQESARFARQLDLVHSTHAHGALNMVHYAHLRSRDQRRLQAGLEAFGATRLSTAEPAVKARLKAARNVLGALYGDAIIYTKQELAEAFAHADEILEQHTLELFGPGDDEAPSRIMVTLPTEAAYDLDLVRGLIDAGMDLARINCAHDGPEVWRAMIENVHKIRPNMRISMDLAGPKIRTAGIAPGPAVGRARVLRDAAGQVIHPSHLWLNTTGIPAPDVLGRPALCARVDAAWLADRKEGDVVTLIDNRGLAREFVVKISGEGVLAEGQRNAWIADGTPITCNGSTAILSGIPPTLQRLRLTQGDQLILTTAQDDCVPIPGQTPVLGCTLPEAVRALQVGERVIFDDGALTAIVCAADKETRTLEITRGTANLGAHKGINLPDTQLPLPSLTEEDERDLQFIAQHADIVAVSFIRTPEDVAYVLERVPENLGLILKVETIPAHKNLPLILLEGMRHPKLGIMIARGDLAVELGFERLAEVPSHIMSMAEAAHVPVILATQVLETMAKSGLPSRAEITDAAFALRAECVMLNKGPHITSAIEVLVKLCRKLGRSQRKTRMLLRHIQSWDEN
ncbi:pyruvate kinase [Corynebacterium freiburgense]|uniref:pyruvate kinase n=1 Tax=Corynebacterium freiburgense TaxID=556548 RepID=UPI000406AB8D|nr:pyruvate kinase [Corynebacterium freiburgense]WJZ03885.1 Pyruvate kinase I [Corynebacterium freiburgense]